MDTYIVKAQLTRCSAETTCVNSLTLRGLPIVHKRRARQGKDYIDSSVLCVSVTTGSNTVYNKTIRMLKEIHGTS